MTWPKRQGWIATIAPALEAFGDDRGPEAAVATLAMMQVMRRTRASVFHVNAADCPHCARCVTPHERLLIAALPALRRGQGDAALVHAVWGGEQGWPALAIPAVACPDIRPSAQIAAWHAAKGSSSDTVPFPDQGLVTDPIRSLSPTSGAALIRRRLWPGVRTACQSCCNRP
jgi:hypothetical protein